MTVAPSTPSPMGVSRLTCRLVMTLSIRYFVEAGSTNPATRLTAMSANPSASRPRLGLINAHTSGKFFHAFLRFLSLEESFSFVSVVMRCWTSPALPVGCSQGLYNYIIYMERGSLAAAFSVSSRCGASAICARAVGHWRYKHDSVAGGAGTFDARSRGTLQV